MSKKDTPIYDDVKQEQERKRKEQEKEEKEPYVGKVWGVLHE